MEINPNDVSSLGMPFSSSRKSSSSSQVYSPAESQNTMTIADEALIARLGQMMQQNARNQGE